MSTRQISAGDPQIALLANAVEHVADVVEISDRECRIQYVNRAFERLTGYSREDVMGQTFSALICDDAHDASFMDDIVHTVLSGDVWRGRLVSRTKSRERVTQEVIISPIRDDSGQVSNFVTIKRDMSERENVQRQLMESERMSTMGQLTAGVAHEINNPLSLILANADFLDEQVAELARGLSPEPGTDRGGKQETDRTVAGGMSPSDALLQTIRASIAEIAQGVERIGGVVRALGAFSRSTDEVAGPVAVQDVIESTLSLLGNEIKHRARLVRKYGDIPRTWARQSRLGQVFLNLILNAVQAIPVGAAHSHQIRVVTRVNRVGNILIEVSDTGAGIPPEVLQHIFDPFFTTQALGQDVGLRLAVSHSIVSSMGGDLAVHSIVGHGTTFVVSLPAFAQKEQREKTLGEQADVESSGRRVLVIDDEPGVLRVIKRILKDYDVTTCLGGKEALDYLQQGNFDLILCDLMMPEYTGMDLYERTAEDRPELLERFLFVTGGAFTKQTESFLRDVSTEAIGKPFTTAELRDAVSKRLGRLSAAG